MPSLFTFTNTPLASSFTFFIFSPFTSEPFSSASKENEEARNTRLTSPSTRYVVPSRRVHS